MKNILLINSETALGDELKKVFDKDNAYKVSVWNGGNDCSEKEIGEKIDSFSPDIVINIPEPFDVDRCEKDKKILDKFQKRNEEFPIFLSAAVQKRKSVLVHYSSDQVFSGLPEMPDWQAEPAGCNHVCSSCTLHDNFSPAIGFDESALPDPVNKLGKIQFSGEKRVLKNCKKHYLFRLGRLFGGRNFFAGEMDEVFDKIFRREKIAAIDEEIGSFSFVLDVAKKTKEIIDAQKPFGVYHLINGGQATWWEAAEEFRRLAKIKTQAKAVLSEDIPGRSPRPFYSVLINTKLNPLRDWRAALKDYFTYFEAKK